MSTPVAQADISTLVASARRRITRRLLPFLFVLYVLNYVDRVNISFASLQMTHPSNSNQTVSDRPSVLQVFTETPA